MLIMTSLIVILPTAVVVPYVNPQEHEVSQTTTEKTENNSIDETIILDQSTEVSVYRTQKDVVEKLPLEHYVVGVVASEMPEEFEKEALKAQALSARTYITSLLLNPDHSVPQKADVTDTVTHQVFSSTADLKEKWGANYIQKINKIKEAVHDTQGQVIVYEDRLITASYFSTSNGFTENSEDYWSAELPYLRSVESPWDKDSPKASNQTVIPVSVFEEKLSVDLEQEPDLEASISERTNGDRVRQVTLNGKELTGKQIREKLNLPSSDFHWKKKGDHIVISSEGYGHGVGMSQYGANGMAKSGKTYQEIIQHYYTGVKIVDNEKFLLEISKVNQS
ncbi:stage II sporulation protein D [Halobacillus sp. Marseille-Q1614]|uniref:stage II sporulation protein D n=1 Tax=Halobacillus sp. Marseille-Q1614 TaxID=2709134 RepID=UPI00156ECE24|nr:stage II sporulation protein D [Halobacillus sp. Marseille-Q1614]